MTRALTLVLALALGAQAQTPQQLVSQIDTLVQQLKATLAVPAPAPSATVISTVADLSAAIARGGGPYRLADGDYAVNVTLRLPIVLSGGRGAVLRPADPLVPPLQVMASDVTLSGFTVLNGAPDRETVVVGDLNATTVAAQPSRVTLDGLAVTAGAAGGHRGIALHGSALTVRNCRVTGFWAHGQDAQAVWMQNGPGPYLVENNYLEGSGETVLVGGDSIKIPGLVPADITIRGNTLVKPDAWRTNGATVKNVIELKVGRRVLIEGNTLDGNWSSGQDGTPVLFTTRNQYGDNPWVVIDQVTFRNNTIRHSPQGFALSILGADDSQPSGQMQTVLIEGNVWIDSTAGFKLGNGVAASLTIQHNTLPAVTKNFLSFYDTRVTRIVTPFTFVQNVVRSGSYGISSSEFAVGTPTLGGWTSALTFTGNVIETTAERPIAYPAGNTLVAPGGLLALLNPTTFKVLVGTAGY